MMIFWQYYDVIFIMTSSWILLFQLVTDWCFSDRFFHGVNKPLTCLIYLFAQFRKSSDLAADLIGWLWNQETQVFCADSYEWKSSVIFAVVKPLQCRSWNIEFMFMFQKLWYCLSFRANHLQIRKWLQDLNKNIHQYVSRTIHQHSFMISWAIMKKLSGVAES